MEPIESHVMVDSNDDNSVDILHRATGLSKQRIKSAMTRGAVWITRGRNTQRLRRAKRALQVGDEIHLYYNAKVLSEIPPKPKLIADAGEYSVWNKPCGMRSQGSKWGDHCTVMRWAEQHLTPQRSAYTVHRLDRAANGLILVAHTKRTAAELSALFRQRAVEKHYFATVSGDLSALPKPLRLDQPLDDKEAISEISFLQFANGGSRSIVDISIETGRKHQVRRHLAGLGHPIIGDRLYGAGEEDGVDLKLTAFLLAFRCPVNDKRVEYRLTDDTLTEFRKLDG